MGNAENTREKEVVSTHSTNGLLLAKYKEGCSRIRENMPQMPSIGKIHTYPQGLHSMVNPLSFHTWGLDLVGQICPPSNGNI